jgi:hypothetical protein
VIDCSAISAHFLRPLVRRHKFINKATPYSTVQQIEMSSDAENPTESVIRKAIRFAQ